ncbi:MAG: type II secretion system minor pseudopilin GspK [Sphingobium sp.]|nr:type II secretion system minor pseudopilin GspK [Sphingobium sp.]
MVPDRSPIGDSEAGAALLTVLLLVAILAVIAAVALDRLVLASRMTRNLVSADQGRAYLIAAEQVAATRIETLLSAHADRTTLEGGWLGTPQVMTVPGGSVTARVRDGGNCFNLNSLVERSAPVPGTVGRPLVARRLGIEQFSGLMRLLGIDRRVADQVAVSAADWIDSDAVPGPGGAEDDYYLSQKPGYRTPNDLMADPSELRMVNAVTPELYERLRPWICTLPGTVLSPVNVNTLRPEQAPLLAMLSPDRLGIEQARQLLARRPVDGYGSLVDFWALPALSALQLPENVQKQVQQKSRWFDVTFSVDLGGDKVENTVLFDAGITPARVVRRQWAGNSD